VSDDPGEVLTTVLGSCVACCLYDPVHKVGGMNHFLLPDGAASGGDASHYGLYSMELLINGLLRRGTRKQNLVAKLFGGARMREGLTDVGRANAAFARHFLYQEGIACVTSSLGGTQARRVRFWPTTGRAQMRLTSAAAEPPRRPPAPPSGAGDVTLF
jgi:chemotaxis protein CheD